MAEKKQHTIISASTGKVMTDAEKKKAAEIASHYHLAKPTGNSKGKRIAAIILWVLALALEAFAIIYLFKNPIFTTKVMIIVIAALVLDLVCVIIAGQLWKKANHISPASEKNKFLFWLYNNLGSIMSIAAFLPFIILVLTNKESDKKTKTIAVIVAAVALLAGAFAGYDYNPISSEEMEAAQDLLGDSYVYWTDGGGVYHTHEDCQAFSQTEELKFGTVDQAVEVNKTRLCKFCARRDDIDTSAIATDGEVDENTVIEGGSHEALTVYWADGVDGFHMDPDCDVFDEVETIVSGTVEEAQAAGHREACQKCGN